MDKKWYIVYTRQNSEKKVAEIFKRKKIESYIPLNNLPHGNDNGKVIDSQLFKRYVFVRTTEEQLEQIKKVSEVINMVYWMGKPVIVKASEIKAIKLFLSEYQNVTFEKMQIKDNDIKDNLRAERDTPMIIIKNKKANIELASIGYIMVADAETTNVRVISSESSLNFFETKKSKLLKKTWEFNSLNKY